MGTTEQHSEVCLPHLSSYKHSPKPRQNFEKCEGRPRLKDTIQVKDKDKDL